MTRKYTREEMLLVLVGTMAIGCAAETSAPSSEHGPEVLCVPGKAEACACPNGTTGSQTCDSDGMGYGECQCAAPVQPVEPPPASDAGATPGSDAGGMPAEYAAAGCVRTTNHDAICIQRGGIYHNAYGCSSTPATVFCDPPQDPYPAVTCCQN